MNQLSNGSKDQSSTHEQDLDLDQKRGGFGQGSKPIGQGRRRESVAWVVLGCGGRRAGRRLQARVAGLLWFGSAKERREERRAREREREIC